jgi:hypothetical protein
MGDTLLVLNVVFATPSLSADNNAPLERRSMPLAGHMARQRQQSHF